MNPIYLQGIYWMAVTLSFFGLQDFAGTRLDRLQGLYFVAATIPSAIVYRVNSYNLLEHWLRIHKIDAKPLQIRLFGTISPVFFSTLFMSGRSEFRSLRNQFVLAVVLLALSIAILQHQ